MYPDPFRYSCALFPPRGLQPGGEFPITGDSVAFFFRGVLIQPQNGIERASALRFDQAARKQHPSRLRGEQLRPYKIRRFPTHFFESGQVASFILQNCADGLLTGAIRKYRQGPLVQADGAFFHFAGDKQGFRRIAYLHGGYFASARNSFS